MSRRCKECGASSDLWLSSCRHLTMCGGCAKSAAEKQEMCPEPACGALLTGRVTREWRVVLPSWDEVKNYFPAKFQQGLEPDYSTGEKWSLHKDAEHEWTLENESGTSKYKGRLIQPEITPESESQYYLLIHKNDEELMAVPAGNWYEFVKVQDPARQLSLEQAETSMKNRDKAIDKAERRMRRSTDNSGSAHALDDNDDEDDAVGLDYEQVFSDDDVDTGESDDPPVPPPIEEDHGDNKKE